MRQESTLSFSRPEPSRLDEQTIDRWREMAASQIDAWNQRLLETDATFRQYPYWNESYRKQRLCPRYLIYGSKGRPSAYTCLLTMAVPGARIGLINCGLIRLRSDVEVNSLMVRSLIEWANEQGYVFLRVSHSDQSVLDCIASSGFTVQRNVFPFHGDPRNSLLVRQLESDEDMLASFQRTGRYEIRAAIRAGYEIRVSDSPEELAGVWPMMKTLARQKGFRLSSRPLAAWLDVMRLARNHQFARLYSAYLDGRRVQSIFVIRYGTTAEYMLGALDAGAVRGKVSPSCLLHWRAMRDFHHMGCEYYNLGGPGDGVRSQVHQFKGKFRPVLNVNPPAVTLVINPTLFRFWYALFLWAFVPIRSRIRRLKAPFQNKRKTIRDLVIETE